MGISPSIVHSLFQYYGVDWFVMITAFVCLFLIGERDRIGFVVGMLSATFGIIFSYQIGSVANAISSVVVLVLYLRGFLQWREPATAEGAMLAGSSDADSVAA
jgi:nicotinamide riboside transporter PnuC